MMNFSSHGCLNRVTPKNLLKLSGNNSLLNKSFFFNKNQKCLFMKAVAILRCFTLFFIFKFKKSSHCFLQILRIIFHSPNLTIDYNDLVFAGAMQSHFIFNIKDFETEI